jgi:diphthamide biosynthesis enzyme Dph1/Dph2-like protein
LTLGALVLQVSTLGCSGYKEVLAGVRHIAQAAGKKTYTVLMGKPNPAKLANFPEVGLCLHRCHTQSVCFGGDSSITGI